MTAWSKDELRKIAEGDDLHISPFREDGVTYGTPTWIWSVAVGDALYVRAYNGNRDAAKGGTDHGRRHDEGGNFRAGRGADQRGHRPSLSGEVSRQPVSQPNDRRKHPLRNDQGRTAKRRKRHLICEPASAFPPDAARRQRTKRL